MGRETERKRERDREREGEREREGQHCEAYTSTKEVEALKY